jgi:hypothetical protein
MADHFEVTVVSIGYRLAPEDPWPAGAEDCYDAAEWLVKNGPEVFGGELMFTGGEVGSPFFPFPPYHHLIFPLVENQHLHTNTPLVCRRPPRLSRRLPPFGNPPFLLFPRLALAFWLLRSLLFPPARDAP